MSEPRFGQPWRAWQERGPNGPWHVDMGMAGELYVGFLPSGEPDAEGARMIAAAPELAALAARVAEHFADTDAPLGIEARRLLCEARGETVSAGGESDT